MALRLYLNNTATASPFPTTSKQLVTSAPASEVQLGPGEFDNGLPGTTDAGQWNPSSPLADTTLAAEIDNTGASLGTTRQGWLYDVALTGRRLPPGTYTVQLRLRANQGTGTLARMCARVTVVQGSSGTWVTQANLLTTAITGEASHSTGQNGWRAQQDASRITVTSTAADFTGAIAVAGTSSGHTFTANDRLLVELGFCDADSNADRTWRLDYNQGNSFIDIPDLVDPIEATFAGGSTFAGSLVGKGRLEGTFAGASTWSGTLQGKGRLDGTFAGSSTWTATLSGKQAIAATLAGSSTFTGTLVGKGVMQATFAGGSSFSGSLVDAGGASAISATFAGGSTFSGSLVNATPPPTPAPRRRRASGGGGWAPGIREEERREEIAEILEYSGRMSGKLIVIGLAGGAALVLWQKEQEKKRRKRKKRKRGKKRGT